MKGNMFLGYARGSVGDVTFSRVKGQQVGRARNRNPKNPRTEAQMAQRAQFMSAIKFFSRGRQNLFEFAFENKKAEESDYNAFMRINSNNGMFLTREMYGNIFYPALGNWQLSQGSLTPFASGTAGSFTTPISATKANSDFNNNIGELSAALISGGQFLNGDIITFVEIVAQAAPGSSDTPVDLVRNEPTQWIIDQITLDLASNDSVEIEGINITAQKPSEGQATVPINFEFVNFSDNMRAVAMIHSRKTAEGTKVSTQMLKGNSNWVEALDLSQNDTWLQIVLADWKSQPEAILQGSLSKKR